MNVMVAYGKAHVPHVRPNDVIKSPVVNIYDGLAESAHQMVVFLREGVESCGRSRMADSGDDAEFNESIEDAVDGGA